MKQVKTLEDLHELAGAKRSVIVPKSHPWSKPRPAAVLLNQQGASLLTLFRMGMFVYEKKEKGNGLRKTKTGPWG